LATRIKLSQRECLLSPKAAVRIGRKSVKLGTAFGSGADSDETWQSSENGARVITLNTNLRASCIASKGFYCGPIAAAVFSIRSAAFSPIMTHTALVFPEIMRGITDASATRKPSVPLTRN